jgi:hypothetical protein
MGSEWIQRGIAAATLFLWANTLAIVGAQTTTRDSTSGRPTYQVSSFDVSYAYNRPGQPSLAPVAGVKTRLGESDGVLGAPEPGKQTVTLALSEVTAQSPRRFTWSGIEAACRSIVGYYNQQGYAGVQVGPDPAEIAVDIDPATGAPTGGKDLRPQGHTTLHLLVRLATVSQVRSVVTPLGGGKPRVNDSQDKRIVQNSPLKGPAPASNEPGDLLRKDVLDDYIYRLDRYPGRHVDAAIAPGEDVAQGDVTLDYLVTEFKPWQVYVGGSNTGTTDTGMWRERFGFIDNQLTGHDDLLSLDYTTAGFKGFDALVGTYEAPVFNSQRLRWRLHGIWEEFSPSDVGLAVGPAAGARGKEESGGADLIFNFLQVHDLFLDLIGGATWQHVNAGGGMSNFFLPHIGVALERNTVISSAIASVDVAHNVVGVAHTRSDQIVKFGRPDVDREFTLLTGGASRSFYLEPLFHHGSGNVPHLAHELYFSAHGQTSFNRRLIPEEEGLVGGFYTVRGYREVLAAGDDVVYGTAEYRYHIPRGFGIQPSPQSLFGRPFRYAPQQPYGPADWDLIARTFVDAGETWDNKSVAGEHGQTLVSTGLGLEFLFKENLDIRVDWGVALHKADQTDAGDSRVHFAAVLSY